MPNSAQDAPSPCTAIDDWSVAIDAEQVRSKSGAEIAEGLSGGLYERHPLASSTGRLFVVIYSAC